MNFKASLRWKFSLFLTGVVLGSVLLTGWLINKGFDTNFKKYLLKTYELQTEDFLSLLQETYQLAGNWERVVNSPEGRRLIMSNPSLLKLEDSKSNTLLHQGLGRRYMVRGGLANRRVKVYPLVVQNQVIGRAWLLSANPAGLLTPADLAFQQSVNRMIIFSIIILGVIALGLGFWGANYLIINRLGRLKQAFATLAAGDLKVRIKDSSQDELGELATDFNTTAENLLHLEELKKSYLSETAHELRTPLTTIRSHLEAFQDGIITPNQESLSLVMEEVMNLTSLLNDLQDLTSSTGLCKNLRSLPLDLNLILANLAEKFRPLAAEHDLTIIVELPTIPLYLKGDPEAFTKIINNLLSNAIKFSVPGGKIIIILQKEASQIKISIADQGIGVQPEEIPKIFERFYRIDPSRSRRTGGSGLGLSIVKELTEAMGGTVKVESRPEAGSIFTLTFPAPPSF